MILLGSSANPPLDQLISKQLNIPLSPCDVGQFSNGETRVNIGVSVRGHDVYVLSAGSHPINDHLMEALMMCKACKSSNARSITLIMYHYPYSRQDRKTKSRECISAAFVAEMIEIAGVNRLLTIDLHSPQIQGMFRIPVDNLDTHKLFAKHLRRHIWGLDSNYYVVVAPDAGATKRCQELADYLGLRMARIEKTRNYSNNNQIERMVLIDHDNLVAHKTAIIYDDIADTLGTLCKACELLQEHEANSVIAVVTHGVLSGEAYKRLDACKNLSQIICSNSIPFLQSSKITSCDVSGMVCDAIMCIEKGTSLSVISS